MFHEILKYIRHEAPLIHCITNPISINDCANILLAIGARPIMAEHPGEVAEITAIARGLALNLGNITDARMESMLIANQTAMEHNIPVVLDLVGLSCSTLRQNYAARLLESHVPEIVKGNISELRTLLGLPITPGMGVEAGQGEMVTADNAQEYALAFQKKAREYNTVLLATGPIDLVVSPRAAYTVKNGTEALAAITGTGCMTNVLAGACLAGAWGAALTTAEEAAVLACLLMGVAGEKAHQLYAAFGPGSFRQGLMDAINRLTPEEIGAKAHITSLALPRL